MLFNSKSRFRWRLRYHLLTKMWERKHFSLKFRRRWLNRPGTTTARLRRIWRLDLIELSLLIIELIFSTRISRIPDTRISDTRIPVFGLDYVHPGSGHLENALGSNFEVRFQSSRHRLGLCPQLSIELLTVWPQQNKFRDLPVLITWSIAGTQMVDIHILYFILNLLTKCFHEERNVIACTFDFSTISYHILESLNDHLYIVHNF